MKEHTLCALQSNTPHLRSTTQNICFRISIFAVILKDKWSKSHLFLAHPLWHDIFSLSDHFPVSWNLYISHDLAASKSKCSSSRQSNLQVNHRTHLKPRVLNLIRTLKIYHKEN